MKRNIIIMAILLIGVLSTHSQTYYYKYLYTVKKSTGMKEQVGDYGIYVTFANNKNTVYISRKDGTSLSQYPYIYQGYKNGMYVYKETGEQTMFGTVGKWGTFTFSQDYTRMNHHVNLDYKKDNIEVYERRDGPEDHNVPDQMY